jgi:signal transduction histidine kinase
MFGPDLSYAEIFSLIAVERRHNGVAPPCNLRRPVRGGTVDVPADPAALRRRQIGHDIDHQLATIMLLASLIDTADDVGTDSRQRARQSWVRTDRLACWRALRNLVGNAVRSAGPAGRVRVGVVGDGRWTVAVVDDDGPGFGEASPGSQSLGLGIAHGFAAVWDGHLEIHRGNLGGCRARLRLRAAAPGPSCAC